MLVYPKSKSPTTKNPSSSAAVTPSLPPQFYTPTATPFSPTKITTRKSSQETMTAPLFFPPQAKNTPPWSPNTTNPKALKLLLSPALLTPPQAKSWHPKTPLLLPKTASHTPTTLPPTWVGSLPKPEKTPSKYSTLSTPKLPQPFHKTLVILK